MPLLIEQQTRDIGLVRTPLGPERTRVVVRPGDAFRFVDDAGQVPARFPNMRVRRLDNNLIIDGLPDGREIELNNFFGACRPGAECTVSLEGLGVTGTVVTEETAPIAPLSDGSFLLYADTRDATALAAALPAAKVVEAAGGPSWLAIGGVAGGLAIAGAAAGGGGGGGGGPATDTTPPDAPVITSGPAIKRSAAIVTGEAEAGARVTLRVDVNGNGTFTDPADLSFSTTADASGRWQVDLRGTPTSGSPPAGGLADGQYALLVQAVDAAQNASGSTRSAVTIDGVPPAVPTIAVVAGNDVVNVAEARTGVTVSGTAEAGSSVTVTWGGTTLVVPAGANGAYAATFTGSQFPADGNAPVSVTASDAAGNASPTASRAVVLDTTAPQAPTITSAPVTNLPAPTFTGTAEPNATVVVQVDRNNDGSYESSFTTTASATGSWSVATTAAALGGPLPDNSLHGVRVTATDTAGNSDPSTSIRQATIGVDYDLPPAATITSVSGTSPPSDTSINAADRAAGVTILGTLTNLYAGRPVTVTWGGVPVSASVSGQNWSATFAPGQVPADGASTITVTYTSVAGTPSVPATRDVSIDTLAPTAPAAPAIAEGAGGLNAAEAADGTDVVVSLAGTGAAVNDVLTIGWGTRTVTRTLTSADITSGSATVSVPAGTITAQGDGNVLVTASIRDVAGNAGPASPATTVAVDAAPPNQTVASFTVTDDVAPVLGAVAAGGTTNDATPAIALTLSAPLLAGETLRLFRDGGATAVATQTAGATLAFPEPAALPEGAHQYTATITDAAGNTSTLDLNGAGAGTAFTFTVDTIAPTQALASVVVTDDVAPNTGPVAVGGTTNDARPQVVITLASALQAGETLSLFRDGGATAVATQTTGTTLDFTEPGSLSAGSHVYTASISDAAGNVTTLDLNGGAAGTGFDLNVVTGSPTQVVQSLTVTDDVPQGTGPIASGGVTNDAQPRIVLTLSAALQSGETLSLFRDGGATAVATQTTGATLDFTESAALSSGAHSYTASISNAAGNTSTLDLNGSAAGETFTFTVDTVLPAAPAAALFLDTGNNGPGGDNGTRVTSNGRVDVSGLEAGATLQYALDGGGWVTAGTSASGGTLSVNVTGDGARSFAARQIDAAGNVGPAGTALTFTLDTSAPSPTLGFTVQEDGGATIADNTPPPGSADTTPTVTLTLTSVLAVGERVTLTRDSTTIAVVDGSGAVPAPVVVTEATALSSGQHIYSASATDLAGNSRSLSLDGLGGDGLYVIRIA